MFHDRAEAGRVLADRLAAYRGRADVVVLALPRGGVPVAFEVARSLGAPLDVYSVRKLGVPGQEELAMGAIAGDGTRVLNQPVVEELGISQSVIDAVAAREQQELERRDRTYRDRLPRPELHGKVVIVVDDGLATGATMQAAVAAVRRQDPARIVVAVPVGAEPVCQELQHHADQVVCATTPAALLAVGQAYRHFEQVTDEDVRALLHAARAHQASPGQAPPTPGPTGVGPGTGVGTAGTGVTTVPADTGDLAGAPEEAAAHRAHARAQRGRGRAGSTVGFELLERAAGVGIRARGTSLEEAFEQATLGLADMLGVWRPGPGDQVEITLGADDLGGLLVAWLNEILQLHRMLGGVRIKRVADRRIQGSVVLVPATDGPPKDISAKAVTDRRLRVGREESGWLAEVHIDV